MAITLDVTKETWETLYVRLHMTGLTPGTRYDLHRLQLRYLGEDEDGTPIYHRQLPDKKALWSAVAHRVGWKAPAASVTVKDYESPLRPTKYFLVPTSAQGPFEYTNWKVPYPVSRGVLCPDIVHFARDIAEEGIPGQVLVRSTQDLQKFVTACVVDIDDLKYTARGTELAVMGSQYPVYVADTREARRGTITLKVDNLGEYNDLMEIAFPNTGAIWPLIFNNASTTAILLDDMKVMPLDVTVEQATHNDADVRYVHIDFVEIAYSAAILKRAGDNDNEIDEPRANFSISDTTPGKMQYVTLTDTSTGQFDSWEWTIGHGTGNKVGKFYTKGPHKVRWGGLGLHHIKLRVYGSVIGYDSDGKAITAGSDTRTRTVTVHR